MSESTRRNFLIASGAGAAAAGVAAALPGSAGAAPAAASPTALPAGAAPLVAHVGDPSTGTMSLFVADREVLVHDPDLVARLAHAAAGTTTSRRSSGSSIKGA